MSLNPKNRKEILDVCQNNFWNYSIITKFLIITNIILYAFMLSLYFCKYIYPTACDIIYGNIIGWDMFWKILIAFILYEIINSINLIFVSISGVALCKEENWDVENFAYAWMNLDKDNYKK